MHAFIVGHTGAMRSDNAVILRELGISPSRVGPFLSELAVSSLQKSCAILSCFPSAPRPGAVAAGVTPASRPSPDFPPPEPSASAHHQPASPQPSMHAPHAPAFATPFSLASSPPTFPVPTLHANAAASLASDYPASPPALPRPLPYAHPPRTSPSSAQTVHDPLVTPSGPIRLPSHPASTLAQPLLPSTLP